MPQKPTDRVGNKLSVGDTVVFTPTSHALIGKVAQIVDGGQLVAPSPDLKHGMMMPSKIYIVMEFVFDPRMAFGEFIRIVMPDQPPGSQA